jgi:choline dehydrogenase-like flavoprotein
MKKTYDFVVVGSGGGGATIAWLLARSGASVCVIEQGEDLKRRLMDSGKNHPLNPVFNRGSHDEYQYRWRRPDFKRRPRGDYNTFRRTERGTARPFKNGWTGSVLGGGGVIWGTWSFRPLPVDLRLKSHYRTMGSLEYLASNGYTVEDWPVTNKEFEPYFNVAETLLGVSGDKNAMLNSIRASTWFQELSKVDARGFPDPSTLKWADYPCLPFPRTPVGEFVWRSMEAAGMTPSPLPSAIVSPAEAQPFRTREKLQSVLSQWGDSAPQFWKQPVADLWSERQRQICTMCGYCGEFICWGKEPPKGGMRGSTIDELYDIQKVRRTDVEIVTFAKAVEIVYDARRRRATGVRFLRIDKPDAPKLDVVHGRTVIVSCGAVQSPRLLFLSGPSRGLGNHSGQLGRHATFHLFGLSGKAVLNTDFTGLLWANLGHTGNVTSFAPYFLKNDMVKDGHATRWVKAGTVTSTAKKNPLENALEKSETSIGGDLTKRMQDYNRTVEVRLTGDDLPMSANRVDLDPAHVDEYGVPVARITRNFGVNELLMFDLARGMLESLFVKYKHQLVNQRSDFSPAIVDLIGDHQMGTCRMGDDPDRSVLDRNCRVWETENVYVVDSSFMPTGLGLNPMVTVVANALRVGTWLVEHAR